MADFRTGFGYDVHRLEQGYRLVIGGVDVPSEKGSVAHSDGDVLLHAICDAILGAAALGDIGTHFPDTDPHYENIPSSRLLEKTLILVGEKGYRVVNIDSTVCLQNPKLAPYIQEMQANLSHLAGTSEVSIKATTTEKLGFIGEGKGISAYAVVLLVK